MTAMSTTVEFNAGDIVIHRSNDVLYGFHRDTLVLALKVDHHVCRDMATYVDALIELANHVRAHVNLMNSVTLN